MILLWRAFENMRGPAMKKTFLPLAALTLVQATFGELNAQVCSPGQTCISDAPRACKYDRETLYQVQGCSASVVASWDGTSAPVRRESCLANPPQGYFLVDHTATESSSNNGSYTISKYVAGLDFHYEEAIDEAYKSALDLAGKIADETSRKEVEQKITAEWNAHKSVVINAKTNADTVKIEVVAQGHGAPWDRKRGWEDASVTLKVRCLAPSNLEEQIKQRHNLLLVKAGLPKNVKFQNSSLDKALLVTKNVDIFTKCEQATSAASMSVIDAQREGEFLIDPELQVCYRFTSLNGKQDLSNNCRGRVGDIINIRNVAPECKD